MTPGGLLFFILSKNARYHIFYSMHYSVSRYEYTNSSVQLWPYWFEGSIISILENV
jgi:hypothetical protein